MLTPPPTASRLAVLAVLAAIAGGAASPLPASGQRTVTGEVRIAIGPILVVRSAPAPVVVPVTAQPDRARRSVPYVDTRRDLVVDANTGYSLRVRLGATATPRRTHVLVRSDSGTFAPLGPGDEQTILLERRPGRTTHAVVCRVDDDDDRPADAAGCALTLDYYTPDGLLLLASVPPQ